HGCVERRLQGSFGFLVPTELAVDRCDAGERLGLERAIVQRARLRDDWPESIERGDIPARVVYGLDLANLAPQRLYPCLDARIGWRDDRPELLDVAASVERCQGVRSVDRVPDDLAGGTTEDVGERAQSTQPLVETDH